jgi:hypothetical protein
MDVLACPCREPAPGHRVIATLRGLTQALFRAVAPLLAAVTLGFLATLPFTGLEPLFAARSAASIVMGWIAAHAVFLNAVYLDGSERPPYAPLVRRLVEAGTAAAPALAAIGLYAIALRIEQHGLTPERVFAGVSSAVLGLYALGYAGAALLRGEPWMPHLRSVNVEHRRFRVGSGSTPGYGRYGKFPRGPWAGRPLDRLGRARALQDGRRRGGPRAGVGALRRGGLELDGDRDALRRGGAGAARRPPRLPGDGREAPRGDRPGDLTGPPFVRKSGHRPAERPRVLARETRVGWLAS